MSISLRLTDARARVFVVAFLCAAAFACFTDHVWEDYYITYRASKNLAMGHGLVFNHGDRLHTFTSPLGVLLPALSSALVLNRSDFWALWIFRAMSCAAFGGAAAFLFATLRHKHGRWLAAAAGVAWLCLDAKSVDFSINGMETAFMLLFLSYMLWALFTVTPERGWLHLGVAWGGLMWTRPDSFIYIGLVAVAAWLFNAGRDAAYPRRKCFPVFLKAGALCTVIYLPWFLWAWSYYGSPVPHTIVAKASVSTAPWTLASLVSTLTHMPLLAWNGQSTIDAAFLPTYFMAGGWPHALLIGARAVGIAIACLWLLPRVSREARAASLAFLGAHIYLTYFPYFPFPWYLPPTTLLGLFAVSTVVGQIWQARAGAGSLARFCALAVTGGMIAILVAQLWMFQASARQMRALQTVIDTGNRRKIGEWLAEHAKPTDRVFLEPLGYIGYFSNLKTYDWPGLSSREVVAAHKKVGAEWARVVDYLGPDWLVLRPIEEEKMKHDLPALLNTIYEKVQVFDVQPAVAQLQVPGQPLLAMDAVFSVYHRRWAKRFVTEYGEMETIFAGNPATVTIGGISMQLVHAPGSLTVKVPRGATQVRVTYGINPDAYAAAPFTDGATFEMLWKQGTREEVVFRRSLNPLDVSADRGALSFDGALPETGVDGALLVLKTIPGQTTTKDWTCWGVPDFR